MSSDLEEGDTVDGPAQAALFQIEGPDEDGCVWICSAEGRDNWCQNLGPAQNVIVTFRGWLEEVAKGI